MSLDRNITELAQLRERIRALREREIQLINRIHPQMTARRINQVTVGNIVCARSVVERTVMRRDNVPDEVWEEYAEPIEYVRLLVRRRSA